MQKKDNIKIAKIRYLNTTLPIIIGTLRIIKMNSDTLILNPLLSEKQKIVRDAQNQKKLPQCNMLNNILRKTPSFISGPQSKTW